MKTSKCWQIGFCIRLASRCLPNSVIQPATETSLLGTNKQYNWLSTQQLTATLQTSSLGLKHIGISCQLTPSQCHQRNPFLTLSLGTRRQGSHHFFEVDLTMVDDSKKKPQNFLKQKPTLRQTPAQFHIAEI